MNREVHVRFCERLRAYALGLLDPTGFRCRSSISGGNRESDDFDFPGSEKASPPLLNQVKKRRSPGLSCGGGDDGGSGVDRARPGG
jgi:hypothetical protein